MTQIWQPTNDLEDDDAANEDDSGKMKSEVADVLRHIPKPRFVACSTLGKVLEVVLQAANVSIGLKKVQRRNTKRMFYLCWKIFEQCRYFEEPRLCSNCSTEKTDDASLFSESAKNRVSKFPVTAAWLSSGKIIGKFLPQEF